VPGQHSVLNSLAAIAVGLELGIAFGTIAERWRPSERRSRIPDQGKRGVLVVDDYGHHPTKSSRL
jgi:UDP-N-acetylmuramate--alanine ligase